MIAGIATLLEKGIPAVQQVPQLAPLLFKMLDVGIRTFKQGREIEDTIEEVAQALQQPQPPKPDPEQEKIKAEIEMKREEHGMDMQAKQLDVQVHQIKAQTDIQKMQHATQAAAQKAMLPQQGPMQ